MLTLYTGRSISIELPTTLEAVAVINFRRHKEALPGVETSKARLMSEAKARRKEKPREAVVENSIGTEPENAAQDFRID